MINNRELRVGNLVKCLAHTPVGYYKPTILFIQITGLKGDSIETDTGSYKYREIDEIVLTETILIKSGAKREKDRFMFGDENTDKLCVVIVQKSGKFYLGGKGNNIYSVSIDSVHHLQNLYFDLRHEELDVEI